MRLRLSLFSAPRMASVALLAAFGLGCAARTGESAVNENVPTLGLIAAPVIQGTNSDASQDAVVLLVIVDRTKGAAVGACTGTLLSDRLVLTARHCVAEIGEEGVACDSKGNALEGGEVGATRDAADLWVYVGAKRPDFETKFVKPAGYGAKILDDGSKTLCNHDIALLLLKNPIPSAPIAPIRLDSRVKKNEVITAVGWGVTATTDSPKIRQQRTGIRVAEVGPFDDDQNPVSPNEFQVGESICSGDSGGPAIVKSKAVVGVVSRGGNGTEGDPNDPASHCIRASNLYTEVAPFKDLILRGYKLAGATPWLEGEPDPRLLKPGAECTESKECLSNLCLRDPAAPKKGLLCAEDCSASACSDGKTCVTEGDHQVCRIPAPVVSPDTVTPASANDSAGGKQITTTTTTTGCSTAPGRGGFTGIFAWFIATVGAFALRRRKLAVR